MNRLKWEKHLKNINEDKKHPKVVVNQQKRRQV